MARSQFTFKFPNAQPGAAVTFSAAVYSSPADQTADGPTLALDLQQTVAVWTDATELTATWVDGSGASIAAEASLARPIVTATGGVPGAAPIAASSAVLRAVIDSAGTSVVSGNNQFPHYALTVPQDFVALADGDDTTLVLDAGVYLIRSWAEATLGTAGAARLSPKSGDAEDGLWVGQDHWPAGSIDLEVTDVYVWTDPVRANNQFYAEIFGDGHLSGSTTFHHSITRLGDAPNP